jgi:hypothetical protein
MVPTGRTGRVAGHAEERQVDERAATSSGVGPLPREEGDEEGQTDHRHPPRDAGATPTGLDDGQQDAEHAGTEEHHSHGIGVDPALRVPGGRVGQPAHREQHGRGRDRQVDDEDPPPAGLLAQPVQDHAADDGPDRGGDPDRRAEQAEGAPALCATEELLDQA